MIRKNIKEKIKEHFFVYPSSKLRFREIERKLKLPLPSVIRYCKELEKEGILMKQKIGSVMFYTANRGSKTFLLEKKLFNLKSLYTSGLVEFLKKELNNPVIIVFGSYSRGEDIEESDIDLFIETPSEKELDLKKFEKILHRKIQIFKYRNISDIKNKHLINNIINGIVINGFIEVIR